MTDEEYEKERMVRIKEFVYDQWRKILTIFVIDVDISKNDFTPKNITSEKIRTIFNNGYKLAMLQTKQSLLIELRNVSDEKQIEVIEKLLNQIEDRFETHKCFNLYKGDKTLLADAIKREDEFSTNLKSDMTKWGDRSM